MGGAGLHEMGIYPESRKRKPEGRRELLCERGSLGEKDLDKTDSIVEHVKKMGILVTENTA